MRALRPRVYSLQEGEYTVAAGCFHGFLEHAISVMTGRNLSLQTSWRSEACIQTLRHAFLDSEGWSGLETPGIWIEALFAIRYPIHKAGADLERAGLAIMLGPGVHEVPCLRQ